jgi:hypothetical protein
MELGGEGLVYSTRKVTHDDSLPSMLRNCGMRLC